MIHFKNSLIFLVASLIFIGNSSFIFPPKKIVEKPDNELVKVIKPAIGKLIKIDESKVQRGEFVFISPGNHTFTFSIKYISPVYCSGPKYGEPALHHYIGDASGVSMVSILSGDFNIDVTASKGQTIVFAYKSQPACKSGIDDFYNVIVEH